MRACPDRSEFLAEPAGRWIAGRTWLYFHRNAGLVGFVLWGEPTPADLEQLTVVLAVELDRAPHVSLVDVRGVTWVDPNGFLVLERYVRKHHAALSKAVTRLALVRPQGILGAVAAGFFGVTPQPYPVQVFDDRRQALGWLGAVDVKEADAELSAAEAEANGPPALLRDLRAWLGGHLEEAELSRAARALDVSQRTLQRRLAEHGVTFQAETNRVRIEVAQRLLRDTDAQLTAIALDVGCGSLPSFSALFRRETGQTPSAWRARQQPGKGRARKG